MADSAISDDKPTLEKALTYIASCEGEGVGFKPGDAIFGQVMIEKMAMGEPFTDQEYKEVYKMLKDNYYTSQLLAGNPGIDIRTIPEKPKMVFTVKKVVETPKPDPVSPEIVKEARLGLEHGNPIDAQISYVKGKVHGGEKYAKAIVTGGYSAYLSANDREHMDAVGSPQAGKSTFIVICLSTFPEENVIVLSEVSPKSFYYLTNDDPERLKDAIVYVNDARPEHIPVLKTFRDEGDVSASNLTVVDGQSLELKVNHRPIIIASSVTPLRDLEGQATSRAFMITIKDVTPIEEMKIHEAIRLKVRAGAVLAKKNDEQLMILRTRTRILRDEGIRDILIPFDAVEPANADRRGTGQFEKFIKCSAFANQFQRPILELTDGRKFVLATYQDFVWAAQIWFDFSEGQEFKLSSIAIDILKALPSSRPGKTAPALAGVMEKSQRTLERYLEDLYESGIASRERMTSQGSPWGYWCEPEEREKVLSWYSAALDGVSDGKTNHDRITTEFLMSQYLAKNSSDSLIDSYNKFFTNNDIINKEMYNGIKMVGVLLEGSPEEIYGSLFSPEPCRDSVNVEADNDKPRQSEMSHLSGMPTDNDSEDVVKEEEDGRKNNYS